jgi:CO/xanthine dehydrogenase FAD-binding subunit
MPRFGYARASTVDEAIQLLNERGIVSRPLAGGTDMLVQIRRQKPWFDRVVDVSRLDHLRIIRQDVNTILIGAAVTYAQLLEDPLIAETAPFLAEAARKVGSLQIRNVGTLGGNVINAAACADSLPPLVCLDALAHLRSRAGERAVPVQELIVKPHSAEIQEGELLTHISFIRPPQDVKTKFIKLGRRNAQSISRLSIAAMGRANQDGVIDFIRLAPGAATPKTVRLNSVEADLKGQQVSGRLIIEAGEKVAREMIAITGTRWSTAYKEVAIRALTERVLRYVLLAGRDAIADRPDGKSG